MHSAWPQLRCIMSYEQIIYCLLSQLNKINLLKYLSPIGLPAVVNLAVHNVKSGENPALFDGVEVIDALKKLETGGADVVGLNCALGPATMLPLLRKAKDAIKVICRVPFVS